MKKASRDAGFFCICNSYSPVGITNYAENCVEVKLFNALRCLSQQ